MEQFTQTFAKKREENGYVVLENSTRSKRRKKSTPHWRGPSRCLPFAVALLLTIKNQIVHIRNEIFQHPTHDLLSCLFIRIIARGLCIYNSYL